jgi:hypothetical protein
MDVALAVAVRCFFTKTLEAMGVLPDASFRELDLGLQEARSGGLPPGK